jgi:CBS domain-containing protein
MWKVRQIMQTKVVTVPPEMPVRALVQVLAKSRISGVPVVDAAGVILGVVSATDVMALAAWGAEAPVAAARDDEEGAGDEESAWYFRATDSPPAYKLHDGDDRMADYVVEDIMTPAAFSVGPDDTIHELARFLLRGRIHRALVVEAGKLSGIVTTFDLLNALAVSADEPAGAELTTAEV